jgi:hypothetical protein
MSKQIFQCADVDLSHSQMVELRNSGKLNLGINNDVAAEIANTAGMGPTKTTSNAAFHFWSWVAIGSFGYSIYLSFTDSWWWFIVGLIAMSVIWKANKKGNSENVLDAAMIDEDFYNRVKDLGGWLYEMEENAASDFLSK